MSKNISSNAKKFFSTLILCLFISFSSIYLGYEIITNYILKDSDQNELQNQIPASISSASQIPHVEEFLFEEKQEQISALTQIVYEYYYRATGETKLIKQPAPSYLFGKNEKELIEIFSAWDLKSFSEIEVHLKKIIDVDVSTKTLPNQYILGVSGEFIAIYYYTGSLSNISENNKTLKEITNIYISPLSEDEQKRLNAGILIEGEDALVKILEDYDS